MKSARINLLLVAVLAVISVTAAPASAQDLASHLTVTALLPEGKVGVSYDGAASASGGIVPYSYAVTLGALPQGLALDSSSGVISGTPTTAGKSFFEISAWDKKGRHGDKSLSLTVKADGVSVTVSPTTASVTSGGSQQFGAFVSGTSNTAVSWSSSAGSVSSAGLFSAPTTTTTISVVVTATSKAQSSAHSSANVTVTAASSGPTILTTSLPGAAAGVPYTDGLAASGGTEPYNWNISSGTLPSGIHLASSTGLISGTTTQLGSFNFSAKVTDAVGKSDTKSFALSVSGSGSKFDGPAELPRIYIKAGLADTPAPGSTISVPAGGNLQAALNSANCGDTIALQAGSAFTGTFTLPAKSCDDAHWVIIRTSAPDTSLPPEGTRLTPCYAGVASLPGRPSFHCTSTANVMAKIVSVGGNGPILVANGANHYRLVGLEITRPVGTGGAGALFLIPPRIGGTADHIVFDRVWMHGTAQDDTTVALSLSSMTYVAVLDSFFTDFHCTAVTGSCIDSHVIGGGGGSNPSGPFKIVDNFLEASAQSILFGGAAATTTPSDIEIRRNHFFKPLIWMKGSTGFVGGKGNYPFIVKNNLEFKNAVRVLVEGNIFENSWGGFSQNGSSILLTPKNQHTSNGNVCPLCQVTDITIRYSTISHVGAGFQIANSYSGKGLAQGGGMALAGERYSIHDVVVDDIDPIKYSGGGGLMMVANGWNANVLNNVSVNHVTGFSPKHVLTLFNLLTNPTMQSFSYTNNLVASSGHSIGNAGGGSDSCAYSVYPSITIPKCFAPYAFSHNAVIGSQYASSYWPTGNYFPATVADVQFVNFNNGNGGDYHLMSTSPYKNAGSDGKDLGADIDAVQSATSGVY